MRTLSIPNSTFGAVTGVAITCILVSTGGCSNIESYFKTRVSHTKLTAVVYHGDWSMGEYRECYSENSKNAELNCPAGFAIADIGKIFDAKIFKVEFAGDVTYDEAKSDDKTHYWLCRRNNGDPSFSCTAKEMPQAPSTKAAP